ncbi:MAG: hypothetical protein JSS66_08235 [Armatimonadetes bacterium]|nr:hypothetical protein [Armatimonadota bacterium]
MRNNKTLALLALVAVTPLAKADDITDLKAAVTKLKADVAALQNLTNNQQTTINQLSSTLVALAKKTQYITVGGKTMYIRGCNVQIQSADTPVAPNGLGNLIIGWNGARNDGTDVRSGSHFLVMGSQNNYSGQGGFVGGSHNFAGQNTVILNGYNNKATGMNSVVVTGANQWNAGLNGLLGTGNGNVTRDTSRNGCVLSGKGNAIYGYEGVVATGVSNGDSWPNLNAFVGTGEHNDNNGGTSCAILTGSYNSTWCSGGHNLIGTGYKNSLQKTCEGVFLADGNTFIMDYDGRDPKNLKQWVNRLASEGYLFDYSH